MAKRVQRRRGTTAEHATFTGFDGETTVDTTKDTVVVHDGATTAGFPLAREDLSNVNLVNLIGVTQLNLIDGTANQVIQTDGSGTISFGTIDVTGSAVGGDISGTVGNAQIVANKVGITELNVSDGTNGQALTTNGSGVLSFSNVLTDPALGGHLSGTTSAAVINNDTITAGMLTTALKNFTVDEFVGAAAQTTFTLTDTVGSVNALMVYIDGIVQPPSAYALPTTTSIQFLTAPPVSSVIRCVHLGFQSTVGVPSDGTITTAKLAAKTITNASITPGTIRSQEIENGTIVGTDIADNSIAGTKLALGSDAQGDVMYYDGSNWARLGVGTSGHVLKTAGSGANPSWVDPSTLSGIGVVKKIWHANTTAQFSTTAEFGAAQPDGSLPQSSEGLLVLNLPVTASATGNKLLVHFHGMAGTTSTPSAAFALFRTTGPNASTNALFATSGYVNSSAFASWHTVESALTTTTSNYQVRMARNNSGTVTLNDFNQFGGSSHYSTASKVNLTIIEYTP